MHAMMGSMDASARQKTFTTLAPRIAEVCPR